MDDLLKDFVTEADEYLSKVDEDVVALEKNPSDQEILKSYI